MMKKIPLIDLYGDVGDMYRKNGHKVQNNIDRVTYEVNCQK